MNHLAVKILIFTEGTLIMHRNAEGHTREEIVQQVRDRKDASLYDWETYIPIGDAAERLMHGKDRVQKLSI